MQIHVARGGQQLGDFPEEEVRRRLASGELQPSDHGWAEGQTDWVVLSSFPGLVTPPPIVPEAVPTTTPPEGTVERVPQNPAPAQGMRTAGRGQIPNSSPAIVSLVCGILSVTILPILAAIPAIICGHVARSSIKRARGVLGGDGMALAGLIMGYISFAALPLLAGIALPVFGAIQAKSKQTQSLYNGHQIAIACRTYANDHNGAFPEALEELVPKYVATPKVFICPISGPSVPIGYEYYGGKVSDPESDILLVSKAVSRYGSRRVVVHVDSTAEVVRDMPTLPPHAH